MLNTTRIVVNEVENIDRYFDLEAKLSILSAHRKNTYTTVVFDCCREKISQAAMRGVEENDMED